MRVFVVDDEPLIREGLRHTLNAQPEIEVVGEACLGPRRVRGHRKDPSGRRGHGSRAARAGRGRRRPRPARARAGRQGAGADHPQPPAGCPGGTGGRGQRVRAEDRAAVGAAVGHSPGGRRARLRDAVAGPDGEPATGANRTARPTTCWRRCPSASGRCSTWWPPASPARRLPRSCASRARPWRPTSPGSTASSGCKRVADIVRFAAVHGLLRQVPPDPNAARPR